MEQIVPIHLVCECGVKLKASESSVGRLLKCPKCKAAVVVSAPAVEDSVRVCPPPRIARPLLAPAPAQPLFLFTCPFCQEFYEVDSEQAGDPIRCRNCKVLVPPKRPDEAGPSLRPKRPISLYIGGGIVSLLIVILIIWACTSLFSKQEVKSPRQADDLHAAREENGPRPAPIIKALPNPEQFMEKKVAQNRSNLVSKRWEKIYVFRNKGDSNQMMVHACYSIDPMELVVEIECNASYMTPYNGEGAVPDIVVAIAFKAPDTDSYCVAYTVSPTGVAISHVATKNVPASLIPRMQEMAIDLAKLLQ
jgi:DNA-directed RNA polymerase subunit RPC12/RpoP